MGRWIFEGCGYQDWGRVQPFGLGQPGMKLLLFVLSVVFLGVVGVVGIYLRFLTVLLTLFLNCGRVVFEALVLKLVPTDSLERRLPLE